MWFPIIDIVHRHDPTPTVTGERFWTYWVSQKLPQISL